MSKKRSKIRPTAADFIEIRSPGAPAEPQSQPVAAHAATASTEPTYQQRRKALKEIWRKYYFNMYPYYGACSDQGRISKAIFDSVNPADWGYQLPGMTRPVRANASLLPGQKREQLEYCFTIAHMNGDLNLHVVSNHDLVRLDLDLHNRTNKAVTTEEVIDLLAKNGLRGAFVPSTKRPGNGAIYCRAKRSAKDDPAEYNRRIQNLGTILHKLTQELFGQASGSKLVEVQGEVRYYERRGRRGWNKPHLMACPRFTSMDEVKKFLNSDISQSELWQLAKVDEEKPEPTDEMFCEDGDDEAASPASSTTTATGRHRTRRDRFVPTHVKFRDRTTAVGMAMQRLGLPFSPTEEQVAPLIERICDEANHIYERSGCSMNERDASRDRGFRQAITFICDTPQRRDAKKLCGNTQRYWFTLGQDLPRADGIIASNFSNKELNGLGLRREQLVWILVVAAKVCASGRSPVTQQYDGSTSVKQIIGILTHFEMCPKHTVLSTAMREICKKGLFTKTHGHDAGMHLAAKYELGRVVQKMPFLMTYRDDRIQAAEAERVAAAKLNGKFAAAAKAPAGTIAAGIQMIATRSLLGAVHSLLVDHGLSMMGLDTHPSTAKPDRASGDYRYLAGLNCNFSEPCSSGIA